MFLFSSSNGCFWVPGRKAKAYKLSMFGHFRIESTKKRLQTFPILVNTSTAIAARKEAHLSPCRCTAAGAPCDCSRAPMFFLFACSLFSGSNQMCRARSCGGAARDPAGMQSAFGTHDSAWQVPQRHHASRTGSQQKCATAPSPQHSANGVSLH